jgi:hypothetical protein
MRRLISLSLGAALIAATTGCAAPVAVVVAKLGFDVGLLVTTEKSSTDHVVSAASGEDCSSWRLLRGKAVCREREGGGEPYGVDRDAPHRSVSEDGVSTTTADGGRTVTLNDGVFVARPAGEPIPSSTVESEALAAPTPAVAASELAPPAVESETAPHAPVVRKTAAKPPPRKGPQQAKAKPAKGKPKAAPLEARRPEASGEKG